MTATPPAGDPATLIVNTVPVISGARVILDGYQYLTGSHGQVVIPTVSGLHQLGILPPRDNRGSTIAHFSRWLEGIALTNRPVALHRGLNQEMAGFVVSHPIKVRFTDTHGKPVSPAAVTSVTIASSLGQRITFSPAHPPASLSVNRVVRNATGLVPLQIRYTVREVVIDGSNVVYGGSQNFHVRKGTTWTVRLLLFPMRVEVRDALFGFPSGSSVKLLLPNGSERTVRLGPGHAVTIGRLPRATYQLAAHGPGIGLASPSSLSKPQVAKLLLLSWVDIAAVAAFVLAFLVGLPILGGRIIRRPGGWRLPAWRAGVPRRARQAGPPAAPDAKQPVAAGAVRKPPAGPPAVLADRPAGTRASWRRWADRRPGKPGQR